MHKEGMLEFTCTLVVLLPTSAYHIVTRSRFWSNSIEKMRVYSKYPRLSQLSLKYDIIYKMHYLKLKNNFV